LLRLSIFRHLSNFGAKLKYLPFFSNNKWENILFRKNLNNIFSENTLRKRENDVRFGVYGKNKMKKWAGTKQGM
jgi:hypothetical protein